MNMASCQAAFSSRQYIDVSAMPRERRMTGDLGSPRSSDGTNLALPLLRVPSETILRWRVALGFSALHRASECLAHGDVVAYLDRHF